MSYITEGRWPVDLIVGTDAGALSLQGKREGGDMQDENVWSVPDQSGV